MQVAPEEGRERRRVLLLTPRLLDTSDGRACTDLALRLDREQFDPVVCCYAGWGPLAAELEREGLEIFPLRQRSGFDPSFTLSLAREIRRRRIDVVHSLHAGKAYVVGVLAGVLGGVRLGVTTFRDRPEVRSRWVRKAGRLCGEIVGTVVATSPEVREALLQEHWVPPGKTIVIPDGVNLQRFADPGRREPARAHWGIPEDAPLIGAVLQGDDREELSSLREAFDEVLRHEPHARLLCSGVRESIGPALGLGPYTDSPAFYAAIDVLCVPTATRTVPLTLLEGLAAGVPIAAGLGPGQAGVAPIGPWAFANLTDHGPESLAQGLLELLREPASASALAREGRACVSADYSIQSNVARVQELYSGSESEPTSLR